MEGTTNAGAGLIVMDAGAIIHRWHAPTVAQSISAILIDTRLPKNVGGKRGAART